MICPEKLARHSAHSAKRSEALEEFQAEAIKQSGVCLIWRRDSPDLQRAAVAGGKSHIGDVGPREFLNR